MTKLPKITMYMAIGIDGMDDGEVRETIDFEIDPTMTDEQNMKMIALKTEVAQQKMMFGLFGLMEKLPDHMEKLMEEQGIDPNDIV